MNTGTLYFKKYLVAAVVIGIALCSGCSFAETASNQLRAGEIQSKTDHLYGKVEVRMFSQDVIGTTSTFFWWKDGGHECGSQWNEIDIELLPRNNSYQSNPIWQTGDWDCEGPQRSEDEHGQSDVLYNRWVIYTIEWAPDYIVWSHDGKEDRRITTDDHPSLNFIDLAMKYCFNLWTQGTANEPWLGNLDFNALQNKPVYQFVDYFKFYDWNGDGFNSSPTKSIDFSLASDIYDNFNVSNWAFGESKGYVSWSQDAVGVVDLDNNNGALWLGLFHSGQERAPTQAELPLSNITSGVFINIEAESALYSNDLEVAGNQLNYINNGAWASYATVDIPQAGQYQVTYNVAGNGDGGSIQLEKSGGGTIYGKVTVPVTGGWTNWTTISHIIILPAGNIGFGLVFADGGFNLESFSIESLN